MLPPPLKALLKPEDPNRDLLYCTFEYSAFWMLHMTNYFCVPFIGIQFFFSRSVVVV